MGNHRRIKRVCLECKDRFMARVSDVERGSGRFCSLSCRSRARWSDDADEARLRGASDPQHGIGRDLTEGRLKR